MMVKKEKCSAKSRRAMEQQPVQRHGLRLQGVQRDQRQMAFGDFAPAVHAGFGFLDLTAVGTAKKFASGIKRSRFAQRGPRQCLDRIAAQQLAPVLMEKLARGKNVAPGNFTAVGYDDADHTLALQAGSSARKAPLHFFDEAV